MSLDGEFEAVVDRIEDGRAVLELQRADDLAELVVDAGDLPRLARRADAVLEVTVRDGQLVDARYDRRETHRRKRRAQDRFDRLSRRPPRDEDG